MTPYRVLARKYRPTNFDDLIGQEVLVQTLSNAIDRGRVAHAFLLHGIRGIGKTTTARIIAKALNCIGEDGQGGATIKPCDVCANCKAIAEDRHMDVVEMDAASRTGVDDIRDIIETVHYAPAQARTKIYIIDEVHMLSKSAFNALLKTLEEPPEHVKFVFATTELRKIPVTILSRCQKFDLRRVDVAELTAHLAQICDKEQVTIDDVELKLIASAAEGSVRDALSLLDQAIALGEMQGEVTQVASGLVAQMLGLADRARTVSLLAHLFAGEVAEAIALLRGQYANGEDPATVIQQLMQRLHEITLIKTATQTEELDASPDKAELSELASKLSLPVLGRSWQMLAKGLNELSQVSHTLAAAEMILIRLAHLGDMPDPGDLVRQLRAQPAPAAAASRPVSVPQAAPMPAPVATANENTVENAQRSADFTSFASIVRLFKRKKEVMLAHHLYADAQLVSFAEGKIELNLPDHVGREVAGKIGAKLSEWSGQRWVVMLSQQQGDVPIKQQDEQAREAKEAELRQHPLAQEVMAAFSGSQIVQYMIGE